MATKRFGYLDDLSLKNSKVGIGTSTANEKLEVLGGTRGGGAVVTGIATLTSSSGFQNTKTSYVENISINSGESGTLSGEIVIGAGLTMSVGTGATTGQGSIDSLKVSNTFNPPIGGTVDRPTAPQPGALYYNKDFKTIEYWDGNFWRQVDNTTRKGRGFFIGGANPSNPTGISMNEYINIASEGNAVNFGDLAQGGARMGGGCSSETRGLIGGGYKPAASPSAVVDIIEYFTMASEGNTIDFGNLSDARGEVNACSNSTRGMWVGGEDIPFADMDILDYVEIATLGNAIDFGDLTEDVRDAQAFASPIRGFRSGGNDATDSDISEKIDFWKFASKGNAVDFGTLISRTGSPGSCSSRTRGFVLGGSTKCGYIQCIIMASAGNAIDFGNLIYTQTTNSSGTSNSIRGVKGGGATPTHSNAIEYFNMSTAGNAVDFGDLTIARNNMGSCSDSHGGLGGY